MQSVGVADDSVFERVIIGINPVARLLHSVKEMFAYANARKLYGTELLVPILDVAEERLKSAANATGDELGYLFQTITQRQIEELVTGGKGFNSRLDPINMQHRLYHNLDEVFYD